MKTTHYAQSTGKQSVCLDKEERKKERGQEKGDKTNKLVSVHTRSGEHRGSSKGPYSLPISVRQ